MRCGATGQLDERRDEDGSYRAGMWEHGGNAAVDGGLQRIWDYDAESDPPPNGWWDEMGLFHPISFAGQEHLIGEVQQDHWWQTAARSSLHEDGLFPGAAPFVGPDADGAAWSAEVSARDAVGASFDPLGSLGMHAVVGSGDAANLQQQEQAPADLLSSHAHWSSITGKPGGAGGGAQSWSERLGGLQRERSRVVQDGCSSFENDSHAGLVAKATKTPKDKDKKKNIKQAISKPAVSSSAQPRKDATAMPEVALFWRAFENAALRAAARSSMLARVTKCRSDLWLYWLCACLAM